MVCIGTGNRLRAGGHERSTSSIPGAQALLAFTSGLRDCWCRGRAYSPPLGWLRAMVGASFLGLAPAAPALADVYAFRGDDGIEHYTNQPGLSGYELLVAVLVEQADGNQAGAAPVVRGVDEYLAHVETAAEEFSVDKALVHAVITAESGYNARAVSRAGAQGLMQLMPQTAMRYGVQDAFDPAQNIRGGTRYLSDLLRKFGNDMSLALAAYNAGENAVLKHGRRIPPYRETLAYVPKVLGLYEKFRGGF